MDVKQPIPADKPSVIQRVNRIFSDVFLYKGSQILMAIGGVSLILLAVISFVTVVFRRTPLAGAWLVGGDDLSSLLMSLVSVLTASLCWYKKGHLQVDVIIGRLGPKAQNIIAIVSAALFLICIVVIVWSGWGIVAESLTYQVRTIVAQILVWPFLLLFFLGLAHFAIVLIRSIVGLVAKAMGRPVEHDGLY